MFRERFLKQEPRLVEAAERLAHAIRAIPQDPAFAASPHALLVGGFVRDVLLGGQPKDIDLEVYGVAPDRLEQLLETLAPGLVNFVGRSFGVFKIHLGEDIEFDVSLPRRESKTGRGHTGFIVTADPGLNTREASRRRDFTINAISADPLTGEILDPFDGVKDLENRVLRVVDSVTFQDDPLRVYRGIQFVARFGLTVEPISFDLMRQMVARDDLAELAPERVTEELRKLLLKAQRPSIGFELARALGIIANDFSELSAMIGTEQEPEWHPEGDVWIHTMMVIDRAAEIIRDSTRGFSTEEQLEVMLGALCHDLGKPGTTARLDGRIRSLGHEEAGIEPTRSLLGRLAFGERVRDATIAIVKDHLKPGMLYKQLMEKQTLTEESYANAVRKLLKRIHPTSWRVLVAAAEADYRGRSLPEVKTGPYLHGDLVATTVAKFRFDAEPIKPLIQGRDLLALGVKPGPRMGEIIAKIETLRDAGKITTQEEAKMHLRDIL